MKCIDLMEIISFVQTSKMEQIIPKQFGSSK